MQAILTVLYNLTIELQSSFRDTVYNLEISSFFQFLLRQPMLSTPVEPPYNFNIYFHIGKISSAARMEMNKASTHHANSKAIKSARCLRMW